MVEDVNFERWLVNYHYTERICQLNHREEEDGEWSLIIPDHMRKYFHNVYTEEGRKMQ